MSTDQTSDKPKQINVLSIDGGGIRGIIPAMVLAEIESRTKKRVCQLFDIIAGTSTGGILALGLTKPNSNDSSQPQFKASELVDLYAEKGQKIFPKRGLPKLRKLFGAQYSALGIETLLNEYFGNSRLRDALTTVIITSYDIENRQAFFFRSVKAQDPKTQGEYDFPMKQVARATSAAPTYFVPSAIPSGSGTGRWALIDGGVYANNPAMCAYVEALKLYPRADICVVSLGTGQAESRFTLGRAREWGLISWARPLIDITLDGPGDTVEYQLGMLLQAENYYRFQTGITHPDSEALDNADPANIKRLQALSREMIVAQTKRIDEACSRLLRNKP